MIQLSLRWASLLLVSCRWRCVRAHILTVIRAGGSLRVKDVSCAMNLGYCRLVKIKLTPFGFDFGYSSPTRGACGAVRCGAVGSA